LRVARTIADLDGAGGVRRLHIAEALSLRRIWAQNAPANTAARGALTKVS
jgi:predicted ATPase with chaperone activity